MQVISPVNLSHSFSRPEPPPAYIKELKSDLDLEAIYISLQRPEKIENTPIDDKYPQYVKVPKDIASVPSPKKIRLYAHFVAFKANNKHGIVTASSIIKKDQSSNYRWLKELVAVGWAVKEITGRYRLKKYQEVWELMGCRRHLQNVTKKNHRYHGKKENKIKRTRFQYFKIKIDDLPDDRRAAITSVKEKITEFVLNRKCQQYKYMLNRNAVAKAKGRSTNQRTLYSAPVSCRKIAEWLGCKSNDNRGCSPRSGFLLRKKFLAGRIEPVPGFQVDPETLKKTPLRNCFLLHF